MRTPALDGLSEVARRLPADALVGWFEERQECSNAADRLFQEWLRIHPADAPQVFADLESRLRLLARLSAAVGGTLAGQHAVEAYVGSGIMRGLLRAGAMKIEPYEPTLVHVDAADLRLGDVAWPQRTCISPLRAAEIGDAQFEQLHRRVWLSEIAPLVLTPGAFVVVPTLERISLPRDHAAIVQNISSLARLGILVVLAEHIHAGHAGKIMLEMKNLGDLTLSFTPGNRIAQLILKRVDGAAEAYGDNAVPFGNSRQRNGRPGPPATNGSGR